MLIKMSCPCWQHVLVWFLLSLAGSLPSQAQIGFQVSPAKLYVNHSSTTEQTARLHLTNTMDTRLILQATCADWRRDSTGAKVYYPAGTLPTSCCSVVRVTPTVIELAPHEERDILVTVLADPRAGAGTLRNGMVLLTQVNEQETASASRSSQFIIRVQIGVHLYVLPTESVQPDIAITGMKLTKTADKYQVNVQVANQGGALLESQLRLEYLNLATMQEVKMDPMPVNTMPKERFNVRAQIPETLAKGKYLIVAILDSGSGQPLKVAELETELK